MLCMPKTLKSIVLRSVNDRVFVVVLVGLLFFSFSGCKNPGPEHQAKTKNKNVVIVNEIAVPVLHSSEEQFNYTRSWFADKQVKRAALKAYTQLYPDNKKYCGMAALDLAYLQLGDDYRFASDKAYFNALDSYNVILVDYAAYPEIMAKAFWYIGWISTDLLYDREKGLAAYWRVVEEYPQERVFLLPPAPWVSIIYPQQEPGENAELEPPGNSWAALALLEIIKHTEDRKVVWASFKRLWRDYRNDVATGFALRHMLRRRYHVNETKVMAEEFMEKNLTNLHILSDIREEILAIESSKGVPVNED